MIAALVAGLAAGYGVALPVGAVGAYLVALTARTSLRTGACASLGVATADGVYALIAVCGGSALAPVLRPVAVPLQQGSAGTLIALAAYTTVTAVRRYRQHRPVGERRAPGEDPPVSGAARAYLGMWGMTMLNPLTVVYFTALVLGRQSATSADTADQVAFVAAVFAASASWQLLLATGGALLGSLLSGARGRLLTALASSALIAVLAVHLLTVGPGQPDVHHTQPASSTSGTLSSPARSASLRLPSAPPSCAPGRRPAWPSAGALWRVGRLRPGCSAH